MRKEEEFNEKKYPGASEKTFKYDNKIGCQATEQKSLWKKDEVKNPYRR